MSLSILARGAIAPNTAPVFGHLTHTDKMLLCVRSSYSANFLDLSDHEHSLVLAEDKKLLLTPQGMKAFGNGGKGGAVVKGLYATDFDDFTIMGVVSAKPKSPASVAMNVWALGDFYSTSANQYAGIGLFLRVNWDATTSTWTAVIRGCFGGKNKTTGLNAVTFVDVVLDSKVGISTAVPDFNFPAHFAVAKIETGSTSSTLTVSVPSLGLETSRVIAAYDYTGNARKEVQTTNAYENKPIKIVGCYSGTPVDTPDDQITVKEIRLDNVALTEQQIEDQYQATKKWLKAEGVIDISHWA